MSRGGGDARIRELKDRLARAEGVLREIASRADTIGWVARAYFTDKGRDEPVRPDTNQLLSQPGSRRTLTDTGRDAPCTCETDPRGHDPFCPEHPDKGPDDG